MTFPFPGKFLFFLRQNFFLLKKILILQAEIKVSDGVIGNTSGFGPEESRFEPWSDN